ncbi:MAG: plastocyanin/azurin family copper-binding protein [Nitrososphaeraceae archaeon]
MERATTANIGGLSIIFFIVAITISIAFYQFVFLNELNAKPQISEEVANPPESENVLIVEGAALPNNAKFYDPKDARATLEVNNKVVWLNEDTTAHTVSTDDDYHDKLSGKFDSMETIGLIPPGGTYEFIFTEDGEYPYHCEPHPWMTGIVTVVKNFS